MNLFVQDDWRVDAALTVNAGLRYELNTAAGRRRRPHGDLRSGDGPLLPVGQNGVPRAGVTTDWINLAPRVGVSLALDASGTLAAARRLRALLRQRHPHRELRALLQPAVLRLQLFVPSEQAPTAADPFPVGSGFVPPAVGEHAGAAIADRRTRSRAASAWRRAFAALTWTVRWVGACGLDLVRKRNLNQPAPGPGRSTSAGRFPATATSCSSSRRRRLSITRCSCGSSGRPPRGLWLRGGLDLGKSIDDPSAFLASEGNDNTPQNSRTRDAERGLSDFDVRHRAGRSRRSGRCRRIGALGAAGATGR